MVSHWCLNDSLSPQVSWTFLSILADYNNAVVWMVSTCLLISMSFCPFINHFGTVRTTPITTGISVAFMFLDIFSSLPCLGMYISFRMFKFYFVVCRDGKVHNSAGSLFFFFFFFFFTITKSVRIAEIRWSVCISKSQKSLCASFFRTDSGLYSYHLFV